jgi:hypothetical protein
MRNVEKIEEIDISKDVSRESLEIVFDLDKSRYHDLHWGLGSHKIGIVYCRKAIAMPAKAYGGRRPT